MSRLRWVRAPQPAPAGTKCAGLGPAPPGASPAGSLQTQSEPVSGRESARARELVWSPAQPPPASPSSASHLPVRPGRSVRAPARQPARGMGLAPVAARARRRPLGLPLRAARRRAAPGRPPSAPRRPAAARPTLAGASHFGGSSACSDCAPPSRSSRDACSLARAPGLRDPGVPAPGPALVPARAPPRCAAAACAAPSSRAGGYVPAAGRTVRSAGAAGSGLRGAATEPGQRVAASGRRAGGAGGGGEEGEGGSARRAKEEGASERAAEGGRPTSSATIIHLKQVQQLSPCPAAKS